MHKDANGRAVSLPIGTVREIRQMTRMADYLRNMRNLADTAKMRDRYEIQLQGKLTQIEALKSGAASM